MLFLVGFVALLFNCMGSEDEAPTAAEELSDVAPLTELQLAEKTVADLTERHERASSTCENGPPRNDPDGEIAFAETDIAMAESIDDVSSEQEWRIRASLGAEMGLAPNEVNGWRDIYRSRAERARQLIAKVEREERETQQAACADMPALKSDLAEARLELRRAKTAG